MKPKPTHTEIYAQQATRQGYWRRLADQLDMSLNVAAMGPMDDTIRPGCCGGNSAPCPNLISGKMAGLGALRCPWMLLCGFVAFVSGIMPARC